MINILVTQRIHMDEYNSFSDRLEKNYIDFLTKSNVNPILLPNAISDVTNFYKTNNCKGILLTGGEDINPTLYGNPSSSINPYYYKRDDNEIELLKYSVAESIPLLGICRGCQLINVFFGGKLTSDKSNFPKNIHEIILFDNPFGYKNNSIIVNSFHNQIINFNQLSNELLKLAETALHKNIELFKHKSLPIIGMQWHPERTNDSEVLDNLIIQTFLNYYK